MNTTTQSPTPDAADESRLGPPPQDATAVAELATLDGLLVDELRTMLPEELRILAASGC